MLPLLCAMVLIHSYSKSPSHSVFYEKVNRKNLGRLVTNRLPHLLTWLIQHRQIAPVNNLLASPARFGHQIPGCEHDGIRNRNL
jgi:hypothetical protein